MSYRVILKPFVENVMRHLSPEVKRRVRLGLHVLEGNPYLGKPLHGELAGCLSFRVDRFRIVYRIESDQRRVVVTAIGHRRDVYGIAIDAIRLMKRRAQYVAKGAPAPS